MLLLISLIVIAILAIAFVIGGFFILLFGGAGVLLSLFDILVGGFVIWIPVHFIRKKKKNKEAK